MPNLVGIGNSQVPTNAMLGGLAYQDPAHANLTNVEIENIAKLKGSVSNTATAIFVYDTKNDSDGGAWRKRTQNTSWYNEQLGTKTRGHRREFPSVAIIVAESRKILILDGDDPTFPMWMVFEDHVASHSINSAGMIMGNGSISDITMLNGIMASTHVGDHKCLVRIYFLADKGIVNPGNTHWGEGVFNGRIVDRNTTNGYYVRDGVNRLSDNGRCVAMKVTADAPIDSTTGLPTPTFAIGGDGGTHVIVPDHTPNTSVTAGSHGDEWKLANGNGNFSYPSQRCMKFTDDNKLYWVYSYLNLTDESHAVISDIPGSDRSRSSSHTASINSSWNDTYDRPPFIMRWRNQGSSLGSPTIATGKDYLFAGNKSGLSFLRRNAEGYDNQTSVNATHGEKEAMSAQITHEYNTGWCVGKASHISMCSTDTSDLVQADVIYDDLHVNTAQWSAASNTTIAHVTGGQTGNCMKITTSGGGGGGAYRTITTVVGKQYTVTYFAKHSSGGTGLRCRIGSSAAASNDGYSADQASTATSWTGPYAFEFTAQRTTSYITFYLPASHEAFVDQITVKLCEPNRANGGSIDSDNSRNGGLFVYGTLNRDPVATGAELVGYSGWSGSNYLMRPMLRRAGGTPPADTGTENYSTGDWYVSLWWKPGNLSNTQVLWSMRDPDTSGSHWVQLWYNTTNQSIRLAEQDGTARNLYISYPGLTVDKWYQIVVGRKDGTQSMYLNGVRVGANTWSSGQISWREGQQFRIGNHYDTLYSVSGSLALFKYALSAPTYQQVQQMYKDELGLFQPNAKCTLYGSSKDVNAMDYDHSTDILHVGTSEGRSEFVGLNRINNTTSAVTTVLSASNGLVAEQ
tara:strand:+ start:221 stop:2782 length:2562 start_codon:yes stop_codon:yes gene_type:complete